MSYLLIRTFNPYICVYKESENPYYALILHTIIAQPSVSAGGGAEDAPENAYELDGEEITYEVIPGEQ